MNAGGLAAAIDEIGAVSGGALDDALRTLDRERRRIEARLAAVIARAEETGHFCDDGHATVTRGPRRPATGRRARPARAPG